MRVFQTVIGFTALPLLALPSFSSNAATCGSKEVRDIIETQSVDQTNLAKQQLESSSRNKFGDAELQILSQGLKFSAASNYQTGQDGDVKHCKGQLTISLPSGASINVNISYDVISTEDGKVLVNQESIAHESPAEAGAQLLMSLTNPKTSSPME